MSRERRASAFKSIEAAIKTVGYYTYVVVGGAAPRYVYTIGLRRTLGFEFVIAGASFFSLNSIEQIIRNVVDEVRQLEAPDLVPVVINALGTFLCKKVHPSWSKQLLLGANDYFNTEAIDAIQICPSSETWTIDVPDMTRHFSPENAPVWQWLRQPWPFAFSASAIAATNLRALIGERVTEASRFESDEWQLFAGSGSNVSEAAMRFVPFATLLGFDASLSDVAALEVGKSLWRDCVTGGWNKWGQ
jgi:hypothetical protein